ncbi:MAG TPA: GxxExxY protein [Vicinamibacterales bacterium]|jgi:GxxExxY protein
MSTSPVAPDIELLGRRVIGCALTVHRALGPGFLERIYRQAMMLELEACGIGFQCEQPAVVVYRGQPLSGQRIDLVVEGLIIVELKAVSAIEPIHVAQVLSYLKTTGLRLGLLINFHETLLKNGIRRLVL